MMRRLYIILPIALLVTLVTILLLKKYVIAQDSGQGLEVSPPSQEITIDPGKTITITAKLRNPGNASLPIRVHVEDFTAKGDQGQVELTANSPYSIASWTKLSPASFQLDPGAEQTVTATITAPRDAAGGHFGSFVFAVQPNDVKGQTAASVSQEIASLFLVRVSGPVSEKLAIKSFSAPHYLEFGPVPFQINFTNSGNVYVKTYGLINVTDIFGHKVSDIVVPGVNIFPQADRIVAATLNKQFLIGPYTATALLYYGSTQTQSLNATTTFFVFPTRIAVIIIAILLLLFLMRRRLKKAGKALFK